MINSAFNATSPHRLQQTISPTLGFRFLGASKADHAAPRLLASGFHEFIKTAPGDETLALAFAVALAAGASSESGKDLCVCGAAGDTQEGGELYGHGLAGLHIQPERMLMMTAAKEKDLLWTLEEAVASGAFGAVVGSLGAKERLYSFAASRRLKLRAEASGTSLFLLRHRSNGGATAARGRWAVSALPSWPEGDHAGYALLSRGPKSGFPVLGEKLCENKESKQTFVGQPRNVCLGPPRLRLTLERMGGLPPQSWEMEFDGTGDFHMAAFLEDRPARKAGRRRQAA